MCRVTPLEMKLRRRGFAPAHKERSYGHYAPEGVSPPPPGEWERREIRIERERERERERLIKMRERTYSLYFSILVKVGLDIAHRFFFPKDLRLVSLRTHYAYLKNIKKSSPPEEKEAKIETYGVTTRIRRYKEFDEKPFTIPE